MVEGGFHIEYEVMVIWVIGLKIVLITPYSFHLPRVDEGLGSELGPRNSPTAQGTDYHMNRLQTTAWVKG